MRRFVAIASASEDYSAQISRSIEYANSAGLSVRIRAEGLAVLASEELAVRPLKGACGVVIGEVFRRSAPAAASDHGGTYEEISRTIIDGQAPDEFWGDFVAIHRSADGSTRFLHSPCGNINLYYLACDDGLLLIASDSAILLALAKRRRSLNWAAIAHNLVWDDLSPPETCIEAVHEIRWGEAGHWRHGRVSVETIWNPWRYTEAQASISTSEEAVALVRQKLFESIGARRALAGKLTIDLSGGLDSSIIAAACAKTGSEPACINLYDPDTEGDERRFARCVADHLQLRLIEAIPSAEKVNLDICARAHLPRPYVRSFVQAFDRAALQAASNFGATGFLNGGGGDSVFCHLQSSAPVVDALKSGSRAPSAVRVANEVARTAQCSIWEVARRAGRKIFRASPTGRLIPNGEFLLPECRDLAETLSSNLPIPSEQPLPGKIEQVHGIFRALYNLNGFSRSDHMDGIFPLLSQPLVEACLRIPTWMCVGEGRNRLIARRAMASELPPMAMWRTSKGGLGRLQRDIVRTKREQIRAKLLDGQLSSQGLIDRSAIEDELKDDTSYRIENIYRLMRLCDIETWCSA